jgi:hypothetical protein
VNRVSNQRVATTFDIKHSCANGAPVCLPFQAVRYEGRVTGFGHPHCDRLHVFCGHKSPFRLLQLTIPSNALLIQAPADVVFVARGADCQGRLRGGAGSFREQLDGDRSGSLSQMDGQLCPGGLPLRRAYRNGSRLRRRR